MLTPEDVVTLGSTLRPPEGHRLDVAVATTYSLDLLALLAAPVAFAMFDLREADDPAALDGLAVLEAVRRHADSTTVFCQSGQIGVPSSFRHALGWVEESIIEVRRPTATGVFHPKCWALRYTDEQGSLLHRVVVLSRNLTFGKSWDVAVVLDESPDGAEGVAHHMGPFLRQLPDLAVRTPSDARLEQLDSLATTLPTARYAIPAPFAHAHVWPLGGAADRGWPYPTEARRTCIVSPFLTASTLRDMTPSGDAVLISSSEALEQLTQEQRDRFDECYVLAPTGFGTSQADDDDEAGAAQALTPTPHLHAKLVVSDLLEPHGTSRWLIGSANATHNAHTANIELSVQLEGRSSACGVRKLLAPPEDGSEDSVLLDALMVFVPNQDADESDEVGDALDRAIIDISTAGATVRADSTQAADLYRVTAEVRAGLDPGLRVRLRPLTLSHESWQRDVDPLTGTAEWAEVSGVSVTPYLVVTVIHESGRQLSRVVIASLIGGPEHRRERLLAHLLKNVDDFLRYLLLLLGDGATDDVAWEKAVSDLIGADRQERRPWLDSMPVLESLMRASMRNEESLRHVGALVNDLRKAGVADAVIPEEFDRLWDTLMRASGQVTR